MIVLQRCSVTAAAKAAVVRLPAMETVHHDLLFAMMMSGDSLSNGSFEWAFCFLHDRATFMAIAEISMRHISGLRQ